LVKLPFCSNASPVKSGAMPRDTGSISDPEVVGISGSTTVDGSAFAYGPAASARLAAAVAPTIVKPILRRTACDGLFVMIVISVLGQYRCADSGFGFTGR
jgi:hypothetical protein